MQFAGKNRARVALARFAEGPHAEQPISLATQLNLAALTDVLAGPHGAGLAWAAFLAKGRVLVEIMPRMRVLHTQLCNGPTWDATPMYAYGGLSLVVGVRHVCLVGASYPDGDEGPPSLAREIESWASARIRVDVDAFRIVLQTIFEYLDEERRAGRVCPLSFHDSVICPITSSPNLTSVQG